jgi:F-type H+-transporting ATPase subunit b
MIFTNPEFWVAVGFVAVLGVVLYLRVPALVGKILDNRAAAIAKTLDEAKQLREDAQALLEQYRRKAADLDKEAGAILTEARAEAERFAAEAHASLAAQVERRAKYAEQKIAQAEAQAIADVRALAADAAIVAAERLIAARLDDKRAADLVKRSLEEIPSKLN